MIQIPKLLFLASILFSNLSYGTGSEKDSHYIYFGEFTETTSQSNSCSRFFSPEKQIAKVFFVGPTGKTMVINLTTEEGEGPLHGLNLTGLYGSSDYLVERTLSSESTRTKLKMFGYIERNFIIGEMKVEEYDLTGTELCTATADFTGFPQ